MTTTKQYTVSEMRMMRLEDALKAIYNDEGNDLEIAIYDLAFGKREHKVEIPVKSYAVSVLERNKNTNEIVDLVKYNSQFNTLSFYKKSITGSGWDTLNTMYHTTNPFDGLTNEDGTTMTSVTKETLEAWKREVAG